MKLTEFQALSFDCYGTLIDWETGMLSGLKQLTDRLSPQLPDHEILQAHALYESEQQRWTPTMSYAHLLAIVYKRLAEKWKLPVSRQECIAYGRSVKDWPAFPDSADALKILKQHFRLIILSNVDNDSFAASNDRLGVDFDAIYTAQDVGSYKPSRRNFDYMLEMEERRGFSHGKLLHVAESMFHDHVPAKAIGLTNCWIYRRFAKEGFGATRKVDELPSYDFQFNSMSALAAAVQADFHAR